MYNHSMMISIKEINKIIWDEKSIRKREGHTKREGIHMRFYSSVFYVKE